MFVVEKCNMQRLADHFDWLFRVLGCTGAQLLWSSEKQLHTHRVKYKLAIQTQQ